MVLRAQHNLDCHRLRKMFQAVHPYYLVPT